MPIVNIRLSLALLQFWDAMQKYISLRVVITQRAPRKYEENFKRRFGRADDGVILLKRRAQGTAESVAEPRIRGGEAKEHRGCCSV